MEATILNPIQQHLLMMFAYDSNEEHLKEMKEVLAKHFAKKWMMKWISCGMKAK